MLLDAETCYRATKSRDARFDGCFFVCVSSTGIYCRPVCTVRAPKQENCSFVATAAEAEAQGFRPCLRCRPELAPGNASIDARGRIARSAARLIEDGVFNESNLPAIAAQLGVTPRHLRRTFRSELGVSPIAFAQTQRLLLAKRLLTDTAMPVTEIAFAAGFGSLRRLGALFKERYRMSPRQLRKNPKRAGDGDALRFELGFRPPYDWDALIGFLAARCIPGVEEVEGAVYRRIVRVGRGREAQSGWIEISRNTGKAAFRLLVSASLKKALPTVLARVKNLTDVSCNPAEINETLGPLGALHPGLRVPGAFDGFEIALRAILGQQVSVKAGRTLLARLTEHYGTQVADSPGLLTTAFPTAEEIAELSVAEVAALGMPQARAASVVELAKTVARGEVCLTPGVDVAATMDRLQSIAGIGEWTAQYIAMRALAWPDAFLHSDLGVMRALGEMNPRRVLAAAESWRPWRAYAVIHLWTAGGSVGTVR